MRKILIAATAAMLATGAGLLGASAADKLKIGFIYLGPIGDLGWTYQHDVGRKLALVRQRHLHLVSLSDDVEVGDDQPIGADDNTGPQRALDARAGLPTELPAKRVAEGAELLLVGLAVFVSIHLQVSFRSNGDVHDGRRNAGRERLHRLIQREPTLG